jgi:chromosomal replication initiation ATPase DnaA
MSQEKDDISKMLMEVGATAEIVGVSKLTEILKNIQKSTKDLTIEEYDKAMFIINIVCETYSMSLEDFYSNKRKNNRRYALGSVFYILYKKYDFDYEKISFITKKPFPLISILIKEIKEMSRTHPFEKQILSKLDDILLKLENN